MANTSLVPLLLLLSAIYIVAAQQSISNITQGSFLTPTGKSSWLSPSGLFAFGFYPQGYNSFRVGIFLAGFPMKYKTVVWTANRDDPPVSDDVTLRLTEGKLILQRKSQTSNVLTHVQYISTAYMLDSGNFVVYDSNRQIIWQSFDHPTDTILPGQSLLGDQELISSKTEYDSSTGKFRLKMQIDSNLVQYPVDTLDIALYAYWASDTAGQGVMTLKLYSGGNLCLLNDSASVLKTLTDSNSTGLSEKQRLYLMRIDSDGIFRVYSYSLDNRGNSPLVVWASSYNKCTPKGTCGINSYCTLNPDNNTRCECPWGFRYTSPGNWPGGCDMNYTADSRKNKEEQRTQYNMTTLHGIVWGNEPYPVVKMKSKEKCKEACWQDHNCEAAFFIDEMCSQVRLPLRYGRNSSSNSLTYVKWALPPKMTKNEEDYQPFILVLLVGIGAGFVALLILLYVSYWGVRKRQSIKLKENYFKQNGGIMLQQLLYKSESIFEKAKIYTEEELKKATKNFSESNVIGQGGYGTVYKGVLADTVLAIKKSKVLDRSQIDQFVNEVIILSQIEHPNVVKLLGCCLETPVPLLVYEFVTNKTLFYHIHGEGCTSSISWNMRLRIATETASALAHMHSASVHIIHRDIKSANILLDEKYTAKVSDFGVSRLFSPEETHLATLVQGTFGYIDPEYFHSGILTQKSDVYSYGVVLVELLTGANVVSFEREEKERNLVMYFLSAMEADRLHDILEPCVEKEGHAEQLIRVAMLADRCLRIEGHRRPTMREVRDELEFLILKEVDRAN